MTSQATGDQEFMDLVTYVDYRQKCRAVEVMTNYMNDKRQKQIQDIVTAKLEAFEASVLPRMESLTWGWHPLFHIFTTCPQLQQVLPPYPWNHTRTEAHQVVTALKYLSPVPRIFPVPWAAPIVHTYMRVRGLRHPVIHPICGGSRRMVLEWTTQGMTSSPWVVTKDMMAVEGFIMFSGARESMSAREWRRQVEDQFLNLPCPSEEWWQEYLTWIETTQSRAMQQWVTKEPETFVRSWCQVSSVPDTHPNQVGIRKWLHFMEDLDLGWFIRAHG